MIFCHLTSAPSNGWIRVVSSGCAAHTNSQSSSKSSVISADGGFGSIVPPPSARTGTSMSHDASFSRIVACIFAFFDASSDRHDVSCALHFE